MTQHAWLELDENGWILFVPGIISDDWGAIEYLTQGSELGAEIWAVNNGYKLIGDWEYADRLDGTTEIRHLIST